MKSHLTPWVAYTTAWLLSCWVLSTPSAVAQTTIAKATASASVNGKTPPNIVLIMADDLGLDGVSCYGADKHQTPEIDRLAASGTRFQTCYAAPVCGPTRALLMTGRYAFRTGGLTNQSWRPGGPGAKSTNEYPLARLLKEAGYATGMVGKWRQVGETPREWGFDEYITDPTASGFFWKTVHQQNGQELQAAEGSYAPDVIHQFALDFIRRHQKERFFLYYSSHHVHGPIEKTPDTRKNSKTDLYDDNLAYLDKQVGSVVAELEKLGLRENTVILFTTDNGTALNYPSTIGGRMLNGKKGSLLEGGSRVPLIVSWPGRTPAGKVSADMISLVDMHATFAELAGAETKLPANLKFDSQSFAPQILGQSGKPRDWIYVQLGNKWFVREKNFKLNEQGELFDMTDAPFTERPIGSDAETSESKAARDRLQQALAELNPAAGKKDSGAAAKPKKAPPKNAEKKNAEKKGPEKKGKKKANAGNSVAKPSEK